MEPRDLFQFSVENALEIIIGVDGNGQIVYANRSAMEVLEYGDDLYGKTLAEIYPATFRMENGKVVMKDLDLGILRNVMAYRRNRTCFPVKMKMMDSSRYMEGMSYICMAYDITHESFWEKKASQAVSEAEEALKVKSEFVANVTHELRTPVNGILGNTQELLERETDYEKLKLMKLVERSCRDMNSIINNILDFSKLEAGKFSLESRKFHFRNMIDYVKGNHSNRINEKGLDFTLSISPKIPEYVVGDELRLVQILNNLISNAAKFTSVGEIHVEAVQTAQSGNRIELFFMVIDTGIGIAKSAQDKLFKSFSQTDASISRKYGGTGLGLNICKQLVELMGGSIHVESEAGKGSIFSFNVWLELTEEANKTTETEYIASNGGQISEQILMSKLQNLLENNVQTEKIWKYGEKENKEEVEKKMSKLILCMEMDNWEKAEGFAEMVRELLADAPPEIKSQALRLKMAVQKGAYDKSVVAFENLKSLL